MNEGLNKTALINVLRRKKEVAEVVIVMGRSLIEPDARTKEIADSIISMARDSALKYEDQIKKLRSVGWSEAQVS